MKWDESYSQAGFFSAADRADGLFSLPAGSCSRQHTHRE
jgi:hypothetical protein